MAAADMAWLRKLDQAERKRMPWLPKPDAPANPAQQRGLAHDLALETPAAGDDTYLETEPPPQRDGAPSTAERKAEALLAKLDQAKARSATTQRPASEASSHQTGCRSVVMRSAEATGAEIAPNTPISVCGMHVMIHGHMPWRSRLRGASSERALGVGKVHALLHEIESKVEPGKLAVHHTASAQKTKQESILDAPESVTFASPATFKDWLVQKDAWRNKELLGGGHQRVAYDAAKERKERRQREKADFKSKLEHEAMDAKLRFGPSTHEKEVQRKRTEMTKEATFAQERQRRLRFASRSMPRHLIVAACVGVAELFLVISLFISRGAKENKPPRNSAPQSLTLLSLAGLFGCIIYIMCAFALYIALQVLGAKSQLLANLSKVVIGSLYLARTTWLYSVVSFVLYLPEFLDRVGNDIIEGDGNTYIIAVLQVLSAVILVPGLVYCCLATQWLFNDLVKLVMTPLSHHFAYNIEIQLVLSAIILIMVALGFESRIRPVDPDSFYIFMTTVGMIVGAILILFAFAHNRVFNFMSAFEAKQYHLEEEREAIAYGLRLQIVDKNPCIIAHSPEKPSLKGKSGVVVGNGVDSSGLVTVLVEGGLYKMQEFQLLPDLPEAKQAEMTAFIDLKLAELEYRVEKQNWGVMTSLSVYIVASQIFAVLMGTSILALLRWSDAIEMRLYSSVADLGTREITSSPSTVPGIEGINCTASGLTSYQLSKCTAAQSFVCSFWVQCERQSSSGLNRTDPFYPDLCGNPEYGHCRVPVGNDASPVLSYASSLILGAIVGACCGLALLCYGVRWMSHVRHIPLPCKTVASAGTMALFVCGGLGTMAAHIIHAGLDASPRCDNVDVDPSIPGVQRLPLDCIVVTGAYFIHGDFSPEFKSLLLGSSVTTLVLLLESTLRLGNKVGQLNENAFAAFEAAIHFCFSSFALICWGLLWLGHNEKWLDAADAWTTETTELGFKTSARFGSGFPIHLNQTSEFIRQEELAHTILLDRFVVFLVGGSMLGIQIIGLYFATIGRLLQPYTWTTGVKVVLYLDSFIHAFFIFIIFLCLYAVNVKFNLLAFILVPACLLHGIAIKFAIQSDIWPIERGHGDTRYYFSLLKRLAPLLLASVFMIGVAFERTKQRGPGVIMMIVSGTIGVGFAAFILLFVINDILSWSLDLSQLVSLALFPRRKGASKAEPDAETEEDTEAGFRAEVESNAPSAESRAAEELRDVQHIEHTSSV